MSQRAYYLASVADKVYLNPEGGILFKGINSELMFLKGTLEKLDVKMQIIRHGKFKSAVEPFMLDKMSPENREQRLVYLNSMWKHMLEGISREYSPDVFRLSALRKLSGCPRSRQRRRRCRPIPRHPPSR